MRNLFCLYPGRRFAKLFIRLKTHKIQLMKYAALVNTHTHTHTLDRAKKQKQQTRTSSRRPMFLIKLYTFAECAHTHWILSERIFEWVVPWCHYLLLVFYFIFRIVPYCLCAVVVYVASVCHFQTIKFPIKNSTEIHMVDRKVTQMNGENEILVWLDEAPYKNDTIK